MKRFGIAALILAIAAVLLTWSQAAAAEGTVVIGSATIDVGSNGSVELAAEDVGEPGLGAWSIDVVFDPDVVAATDCLPKNFGVCNPNFAANTVRVTGASAAGFEGDTPLASLTFICLAQGTSPLTVTALEFADGTLGRPLAIDVTVIHGSINCVAEAQPTATTEDDAEDDVVEQPTPVAAIIVDAGTGPGDLGIDNWSLVIAGLIGAGIAWLIVGMSGAGLAAVTAGALPWRRSPQPNGSITPPVAPAPASRTTPDDNSGANWLTEAQGRLSGADASAIPAFRRSRRRD